MTKLDGPPLITQADYARSRAARGLTGGTRESVRKAVEAGRISAIGPDKLIDPAVADIQWAQNSRTRAHAVKAAPATETAQRAGHGDGVAPGHADQLSVGGEGQAAAQTPPAPAPAPKDTTYQDARTRREVADAQKAEWEMAKLAGVLIEREPAAMAVFTAFRLLRDMLMGVGRSVAPALSTMTSQREIQLRIDEEMRERLGIFAKKNLTSLAQRLGSQAQEVEDIEPLPEDGHAG